MSGIMLMRAARRLIRAMSRRWASIGRQWHGSITPSAIAIWWVPARRWKPIWTSGSASGMPADKQGNHHVKGEPGRPAWYQIMHVVPVFLRLQQLVCNGQAGYLYQHARCDGGGAA